MNCVVAGKELKVIMPIVLYWYAYMETMDNRFGAELVAYGWWEVVYGTMYMVYRQYGGRSKAGNRNYCASVHTQFTD